MKTKISLLLLVSILMLSILSCSKKKEYDVYCTITGTVIEAGTNNTLGGATVTITPNVQNAYTESDGRFEFNNLYNDQYTIQVQKNGYKPNRITVATVVGETVDVSIELTKKL